MKREPNWDTWSEGSEDATGVACVCGAEEDGKSSLTASGSLIQAPQLFFLFGVSDARGVARC